MSGRDPQGRWTVGFAALALTAGAALLLGIAPTWDAPWDPITSTEWGPPAIAMDTFTSERTRENPWNVVPEPLPPPDEAGQTAAELYENVPVLGNIDASAFDRLMLAITEWVAPEQGCEYCHNLEQGFANDDLYTKRVARVMLAMTQHLNDDWSERHIGPAGVTCYTCHRGNPKPPYTWFKGAPPEPPMGGMVGMPPPWVRTASTIRDFLPRRPFEHYLLEDRKITGSQARAVETASVADLSDVEDIYLLMMQMSDGMGVNCTFCHNSRAFYDWEQSTPKRVTGWHALRMTREINRSFIGLVGQALPPVRLGPLGDPPKVDCMTCHVGQPKPLGGASMLSDYPSLAHPSPAIAAEVRKLLDRDREQPAR